MHRRRLRAFATLIAAAMLLAGCSAGRQSADSGADVMLPEPPAIEERQIIGERTSEKEWEVRLCYPSESGAVQGSVAQVFRAGSRFDLIRSVFDALFSPDAYRYASRASLGDIRLTGIELSCGIAVLNLSIDASVHQAQQDYMSMCAAIVNTYLGIDGIDAVNILISDRSDPLYDMPAGAFTAPVDSITNAAVRLQTEQSLYAGAQGDPITRNAVLYFPANGEHLFVPEVRSIHSADADCISAVIDAIAAGTGNAPCAVSPIPENLELIVDAPSVTVTGGGQRIAEISISDMTANYLALSGFEPWQLYGSIVLSVAGYVPEIDGVRFTIAGAPVDRLQIGRREIAFEDGVMRRSDFSDLIGGSAQMMFAGADGGLIRTECALSQYSALSPMRTLQEMIDLPARRTDLISAFPQEITSADVLGVSIADGIASVNLSADFYAACQSASERQERSIAYAIINTLCEFDDVRAVQILIEGRAIDTLAHHIYLKQPLIRDPGMMTEQRSEARNAVQDAQLRTETF